jgi:transcription elongation factor GreA
MLLPQLVKLGASTRNDHPGLALEILMLVQETDPSAELGYSADDLLSSSRPETILKEMINHDHQRMMLQILRQRSGNDWTTVASKLVFTTGDFRLLDALVEELAHAPGTLDDIYHRILAMAKQYPKQFHWMLKRIASGNLNEYMKPTLIPRLIDSLEYVRGIKATAKTILSLDTFDELMTQSPPDLAARIRDAVSRSSTLTDHEKKRFLRIIEHHFPDFVEETTDIIYTTEAALQKKKAELEHIVSVEIPKNKKEIGRAREFGDLSENFEYKSAKEKQDQLFAKVRAIETELQQVQLIEPGKAKTDSVEIGTAVTLERTDKESRVTYRILGRWDTDLSNNVLSNEAPLARAMMGKHIGDAVQIDGVDYQITAINSAFSS